MGGKSAPKPPDFTKAAEAQAESSQANTQAQTYANRPDQNTPFGSTSWDASRAIDPATGKPVTSWTQNTTLTPELQHALESQTALQSGRSDIAGGMLDRIQSEFGPTVDYSKFGDKGGAVSAGDVNGQLGGAGDYSSRAGDALMSQFHARMDPQFQRSEAQLDTTLRNRGLKPGDEAYDQAIADQRQSQGDQFNQAMYQAQQLQGSEAQRLQGMDKNSLDALNQAIKDNLGIDLDVSKFADYQRQRDVSEEQQKRGWSLNEANALASGQQVSMPNMPTFSNAGRADTTNYSGAANSQWGADMDAYNAQQAAISGMVGAVTSPFSMAIPS